ncbi:MAG: hypothetical protein ACI9YH_004128, partial [Colwellia sp.]
SSAARVKLNCLADASNAFSAFSGGSLLAKIHLYLLLFL